MSNGVMKLLIENIYADVALLLGIIVTVTALIKHLKDGLYKLLHDRFDEIDNKIDNRFNDLDHRSGKRFDELESRFNDVDTKIEDLSESIENVDRNSCRNFIVTFLSAVENGKNVGETETIRFWKLYKRYQDFGGNGYIKSKVDKLQSEGKL